MLVATNHKLEKKKKLSENFFCSFLCIYLHFEPPNTRILSVIHLRQRDKAQNKVKKCINFFFLNV